MARTVVAILDRDDWEANTDVIVIADDVRRRLTWVPRDLYSLRLNDRVNAAFRDGGGCERLLDALADIGLPCDGAICLRRSASEKALAAVDVSVPVRRRLEFWYPLNPTRPIEEGRKQIAFDPPAVRLTGELVHQWIGARKSVSGTPSDLHRLERQQTLLKALLRSGFDFRPALENPDLIRSSGDRVLEPLTRIDAGWDMTILRGVVHARIDGKAVLVRASLALRARRRAERLLFRLLQRPPRRSMHTVPSNGRRGPVAIAWGAHVSAPFKAKLIEICGRLEIEPSALMAIIAFETGRSFSPAIRNPLSGATGLIQFIPATAAELGTTTDALAEMNAVAQLDYVERYLAPYAGRMKTLSDAYMAVLWPDAVGEPPAHVLFAEPSGPYMRNRGLDADGDGQITKAEATAPVSRYLDEGLTPRNVG